jgi:hypothetical protein
MTHPATLLTRAGLILVLALAACTERRPDEPATAAVDRDTLTRRQRDSISGTLPIPGARGIGNALRASDAARARAAQHDSALAAP